MPLEDFVFYLGPKLIHIVVDDKPIHLLKRDEFFKWLDSSQQIHEDDYWIKESNSDIENDLREFMREKGLIS